MADFCIICAAPRSGTTFLGDAVERAFAAICPGEIFHEAYATFGVDYERAADVQQRANFFTFRAAAALQNPELLYPTLSARRTLLDSYLRHLRVVCPGERYLLDVKYNSWHHLDGFWRNPGDAPGLLSLAQEAKIPIVHLVRRNVFAVYCSQRMAEKTNIWSIENVSDAVRTYGIHRADAPPAPAGDVGSSPSLDRRSPKAMTVDLEHCRWWMRQMTESQRRFAEWLDGPLTHTLIYEQLMAGDRFAEPVRSAFAEVYGEQPRHELSTTFAKILPPLYDVIENVEEVLSGFSGTEYEGFVKAALVQPSRGGMSG